MKKYVFIVFLWIQITGELCSTNNLRIGDIRSMSMGGNEVTQTPHFNPSLLTEFSSMKVGLHYSNRYQLKELSTISGNFYYPNSFLSAGLHISSFGYDSYRETMFRLLMAKALNDQWSLGISFQYGLLETELWEHNSSGQISTDIGIHYKPVNNWLIGLLIMNFPSISLSHKIVDSKELTNYLIQIGFQWRVMNDVLIAATLESGEEVFITPHFGIEYTPYDTFSIRMGMKGPALLPSFGIGYSYSHFTVDISAVYHSVLGFSNGISVKYQF